MFDRVRQTTHPLPTLDIPVHCLHGISPGNSTDNHFIYDVPGFNASVPPEPVIVRKGPGDGTVNLKSLESCSRCPFPCSGELRQGCSPTPWQCSAGAHTRRRRPGVHEWACSCTHLGSGRPCARARARLCRHRPHVPAGLLQVLSQRILALLSTDREHLGAPQGSYSL